LEQLLVGTFGVLGTGMVGKHSAGAGRGGTRQVADSEQTIIRH
jgi:hypothetical protein